MANKLNEHVQNLVAIKPIGIFNDSRNSINGHYWNLLIESIKAKHNPGYSSVFADIENIITNQVDRFITCSNKR